MKSTIKIELDHDNLPILEVKAYYTDDVRDKMVAIFLKNLFTQFPEQHMFEKGLALVEFAGHSTDGPTIMRIRTLNVTELTNWFPGAFISAAKLRLDASGPAAETPATI